MCYQCKTANSLGDSGSRMWICKDTNKPTTTFIGVYNAILSGIERFGLTKDQCFDEAYKLLQSKQNESRNRGEIYFDEDWFIDDLMEYWFDRDNLVEIKKLENKINNINNIKQINIFLTLSVLIALIYFLCSL